VELLKQPQYQPFDVIDQVISLYAASHGFMDEVPVNRVPAYEEAMLKHFRDEFPEVVEALRAAGNITDQVDARLEDVLRKFKPDLGG